MMRRIWSRLAEIARRARSPLLVGFLAASLAGVAYAASKYAAASADNRKIAALREGRDVPVSLNSAGEVVFARIHFLLIHDSIDEAQALVNALDQKPGAPVRARARYDLGNARMRLGFDLVESGKLEKAEPLINLARSDYRQALSLDPDLWDARYNLDVAMRLIRDFPGFDEARGEEIPAKPGEFWTDLPGKPRGLP
ncbi:conserved hypothetical protein [Methylocella silvestris BL2]|uniref:MxaK protein n=1 Tax=Methylocella silvestris (strain DSM 15510 / CIP 108128 / LMG 27833 / NCIMB 13906 / BL2) TaxID=395965 RepID=B8EJP8_METSB|nr:hypothetical protein [Methylocella silvestris]ACK49452.1 conserved hypothetical protein [Methylocella silvestris BL2]